METDDHISRERSPDGSDLPDSPSTSCRSPLRSPQFVFATCMVALAATTAVICLIKSHHRIPLFAKLFIALTIVTLASFLYRVRRILEELYQNTTGLVTNVSARSVVHTATYLGALGLINAAVILLEALSALLWIVRSGNVAN